MRKLLILGAGAFGRTVWDLARQLNTYEKIGFLDDGITGPNILGRCGEYLLFADEDTEMLPAFGSNEVRRYWLEQLEEDGIPIPTLIHPRAYVSPTATVEPGSVVLAMAAVGTNVRVEAGCIVNMGALVDHDCVLDPCVHLAPGAIVKGENRIPACQKVDSGTVIGNRAYPL